MLIQSENCKEDIGIIDDIYAEETLKHKWYSAINKYGGKYLQTSIDGKTIGLQLFIAILAKLPCPYSGIVDVDHIDENTFNCQVYNLRYLPHSENVRRSSKNKSNSGYKNIRFCRDGRKKPYYVHFSINDRKESIGYFSSLENAIKARDEFALKHNLIVN